MDVGLVLVGGLVDLVTKSVGGGADAVEVVNKDYVYQVDSISLPSADRGVAVLGDLLVGLLGSTRGSALNGLSDVVNSLLSGLHYEVVWW